MDQIPHRHSTGAESHPGRLIFTKRTDKAVCALADRHYSRQAVGCKQVGSNCRLAVIRNIAGSVAFVYGYPYPGFRADQQLGANCELFRNESDELSSDLIQRAELLVRTKWPDVTRFYTYVDPTKIASTNPGYCFLHAGYTKAGYSKTGKRILERFICDANTQAAEASAASTATSPNDTPLTLW